MDDCFNYGSHHELAGKKVEVKSATPRGSGPVGPSTGRGPIGQRGPLPERPGFGPRQGQAYPFPGQMGSPNYGMQFPAMARWASMAAGVGAVLSHVGLADDASCFLWAPSTTWVASWPGRGEKHFAGDLMLQTLNHLGKPCACTASPPG